jgi:hypothetical protein
MRTERIHSACEHGNREAGFAAFYAGISHLLWPAYCQQGGRIPFEEELFSFQMAASDENPLQNLGFEITKK